MIEAIVEVEPPSTEENTRPSIPGPRAFALPLPSPVAIEGEKYRRKSRKELVLEFELLSRECDERGPLLLLKRSPWGHSAAVLLFGVVTVAASVISIISYNLAADDSSRTLRVIGSAFHNGVMVAMQMLAVLYVCFIEFPLISRTPNRYLFACVSMAIVHIVTFTVQWCLFPTRQEYFDGKRETAQRIITFFSDGLFQWLTFLGFFEVARIYWLRSRPACDVVPGSRPFLSQGHIAHALAYLLHVLISLGVFLSAWGVVTFVFARVLVIAVAVPSVALIIFSISHTEQSWVSGYAILFGTMQFGAATLANLLPFVISLGGSGLFLLILKFIGFMLVYGLMFGVFTIIIARMTTVNHAPQFLFLLQEFIDLFVGLTFVELRDMLQFWTLLILHTAWGIFRNTGMSAWCYLKLKDTLFKFRRGNSPVHTRQELLARDTFFLHLNLQSMLSDLTSSVVIPIIMAVDHSFPTGACSISCSFSRAQLIEFIKRYAILFSFRAANTVIVLAWYTFHFAMLCHGRPGLTLRSLVLALSSVFTSFQLHMWRNLSLFLLISVYLYTYVFYPIITFHGFGGSSSSS